MMCKYNSPHPNCQLVKTNRERKVFSGSIEVLMKNIDHDPLLHTGMSSKYIGRIQKLDHQTHPV